MIRAAASPPASSKTASGEIAEQLCLACGLCCDGVLFKDVELQSGDDAAKLSALGLPLKTRAGARNPRRGPASTTPPPVSPAKPPRLRFLQPCPALGADCRCGIYPDRPTRCCDFECALFQAVRAGQLETAAALRTIRTARQRAAQVRQLFSDLGDSNEVLALSLRFKRMRKRFEAARADDATLETYSQLTLAVHDLNLLLRARFFP